MNPFFRTSFLILALLIAPQSFAQDYGLTKHAIYGAVGFTRGGVALGADYEYTGNSDYGVGGLVRMYQKKDNPSGILDADGLMVLGGFVRPHFTKKSWDLYVSPGLGLISYDSVNGEDTTTLGAFLGLGLMYELTSSASIGVENMQTHVWFNEDTRGLVMSDLMVRFRMAF